MRFCHQQWEGCVGAIALSSQQPCHSQLLRATIAWRLGWGGDGERREGAQPASPVPSESSVPCVPCPCSAAAGARPQRAVCTVYWEAVTAADL